MDSAQLAEVERLAECMYSSPQATERQQAQVSLRSFETDPKMIVQAQWILDNSHHPYALLLAATSLLRLVTSFHTAFTNEQTVEIRNYLLNFLAANVQQQHVPPFVIKAIVQVLCRVTKFGWRVEPKHLAFVDEVTKFLAHSVPMAIIGLNILTELVTEMNTLLPGSTTTEHRRTAVSFRDRSLLQIFTLALTSIKQVVSGQVRASGPEEVARMREGALRLALAAISFDYIGTNSDEASDDVGTIQIPSSWRHLFEDLSTLQLMFAVIASADCPNEHAALCLEILIQLASCRRSLFTDEKHRTLFLAEFGDGTRDILKSSGTAQGRLQDSDCYVQFCRLLGRLKANYQLTDLVHMKGYAEWIDLVAKFTIESFRQYEWSANSVHYLLGLWARLTLSIPFLKGDVPSYLSSFVPDIARTFTSSRIEQVKGACADETTDELFGETEFDEQLTQLTILCRYQYAGTVQFLESLTDPLIARYQECIALLQNSPGPQEVAPQLKQELLLVESQLAWLCYVFGAIVSGNSTSGSNPSEQEELDAELSARIFRLVDMISMRLADNVQQRNGQLPVFARFDLSIIYFFQNFRRVYIGVDSYTGRIRISAQETEPLIYGRLAKRLGPQIDQKTVVLRILTKIIDDLKYFADNAKVVEACLSLFNDMSTGYSSSKLLMTIDITRTVLRHHTAEEFPFLTLPQNLLSRTKFYVTLGRIVFNDANLEMFDVFMEPFDRAFDALASHQNFRSDQVQQAGIGLCADLQGLFEATTNKRSYSLMYDWLFPRHIHVVLRLLETYWDRPALTKPLLYFWAELVFNRGQRITFSPSSPGGIILFRETSKALCTYGSRILSYKAEVDNIYEERYKGFMLCMKILKNSLNGGYVNFGVFALYNDKALSNAIDIVLKLIMTVPLISFLSHPDIHKTFYELLDVLFRYHTDLLCAIPPKLFTKLANALHEGLFSFVPAESTLAAHAIDHISTALFEWSQKKVAPPALEQLRALIAQCGDLFEQILSSLFTMIIFETNVPNHWSLARPLLSIILTHPRAFEEYRSQVIATQSPAAQQRLSASFDVLVEGLRPSLDTRSRDKFTQRISQFRAETLQFVIKPLT